MLHSIIPDKILKPVKKLPHGAKILLFLAFSLVAVLLICEYVLKPIWHGVVGG